MRAVKPKDVSGILCIFFMQYAVDGREDVPRLELCTASMSSRLKSVSFELFCNITFSESRKVKTTAISLARCNEAAAVISCSTQVFKPSRK